MAEQEDKKTTVEESCKEEIADVDTKSDDIMSKGIASENTTPTNNETGEKKNKYEYDCDDYYSCWWAYEGLQEEGWRKISRVRELQIFQEEKAWRRKYSH